MKSIRILLVCLSDPSKSPRPSRVINLCLENGYVVDIVSPPPSVIRTGCNSIPIPPYSSTKLANLRRKLRKYFFTLLQAVFSGLKTKEKLIALGHGTSALFEKLCKNNYNLIIVEDLDLLPLAVSIKKQASILLDAREYYPLQRENSLLFRLIQAPYRTAFCTKYLSQCDQVITVSQGLAEKYEKVFKVKPLVVRSVPNLQQIEVSPLKKGQIQLVHHGLANRNRQLEKMIEVFSNLRDEFTFDLYLTGSPFVIRQLKNRIKNNPRVKIHPPVRFEHIIPTLSKYDIGFYYLEPNGFNLLHSLPNKLFEFIQARLAVAIGPSPDMAQIVENYDCGFISKDFTINSMAETLNALRDEDISRAKKNSDKASCELCFEKESEVLENIIKQLI